MRRNRQGCVAFAWNAISGIFLNSQFLISQLVIPTLSNLPENLMSYNYEVVEAKVKIFNFQGLIS